MLWLSNGHWHKTCKTCSLLAQIWRGDSHFSQKGLWQMWLSLASTMNDKYFGECEFAKYLIKCLVSLVRLASHNIITVFAHFGLARLAKLAKLTKLPSLQILYESAMLKDWMYTLSIAALSLFVLGWQKQKKSFSLFCVYVKKERERGGGGEREKN